jgi:hypothetical protein
MFKSETLRNGLKKYPLRIGLGLFFILLSLGFKFSNNDLSVSVRDWNKNEISRIKVVDPENFAFAVFGDNKGSSAVFEPLLRKMSCDAGVSFAVDVGDLVKDGKKNQFDRFIDQVQRNSSVPVVTAIGNHDIDSGPGIYQEVFGPTYYTFQVGRGYFIVLEAVAESVFDDPQLKWLENELQKAQNSQTRFVFLHVPLFDPRGKGFDKCLREKDSKSLMGLFKRYNVTHIFASHIHGCFQGTWEGMPYTVTGGGGGGLQGKDPQHFFYHYVKVNVAGGQASVAVRRVDPENIFVQGINRVKENGAAWGFLFAGVILLASSGLSAARKSSK